MARPCTSLLISTFALIAGCVLEPGSIGTLDSDTDTGTDGGSDEATNSESSSDTDDTGDTTDTTDTTGTDTTDGTDTGEAPPEFLPGDDDCTGPVNRNDCSDLAALTITFVDAVVSGDDQVWNAGEDLTVTVLIGADIDVNYPGIVSRTDNPQVTVNWQSDITYLVGSEFTYEAHAVFQAGPDMDPQTLVHLEVAASTAVGQVSACDCPDVDVDAWIGTFTIE